MLNEKGEGGGGKKRGGMGWDMYGTKEMGVKGGKGQKRYEGYSGRGKGGRRGRACGEREKGGKGGKGAVSIPASGYEAWRGEANHSRNAFNTPLVPFFDISSSSRLLMYLGPC